MLNKRDNKLLVTVCETSSNWTTASNSFVFISAAPLPKLTVKGSSVVEYFKQTRDRCARFDSAWTGNLWLSSGESESLANSTKLQNNNQTHFS